MLAKSMNLPESYLSVQYAPLSPFHPYAQCFPGPLKRFGCLVKSKGEVGSLTRSLDSSKEKIKDNSYPVWFTADLVRVPL